MRWRAIGLAVMALVMAPLALAAYAICEVGEYGDCDYDRATPLAIGLAAAGAALVAAVLSWRGHRAWRWAAALAAALLLVWLADIFSF